MSFWDELRDTVRDKTTTGDISTDLFNTLCVSGINKVAVVQPTFYMGRFYILSCDFMDFVDKLLHSPDTPHDVFRGILYLRETVATMGRCIKNSAEPIEGMMTFLDPLYEESLAGYEDHSHEGECGCECECGCSGDHECECEDDSDEEPDAEFATERMKLADALEEKFTKAGISARVCRELALRLADTYSGCVLYVRDLRTLNQQDCRKDMSGLMMCLVEIQYVMDNKLRGLLLEDVFMTGCKRFSVGLMPWISFAVQQLACSVEEEDESGVHEGVVSEDDLA